MTFVDYDSPFTIDLPERESGPLLLPQHLAKLDSSAISAEIREQRGYYTSSSPQELLDLGFAKSQSVLVPALVIPQFSPSGAESWQIRPDDPRLRGKKLLKYENRWAHSLILDMHPSMLEYAADPTATIFITEGTLKVDALATAGYPAISFVGVDGWRNKLGPLDCWHFVKAQRFVICYDSDAKTNPGVLGSMKRVEKFLRERGAETLCALPPQAPDESKWGVDDFLAAGGHVDQLVVTGLPERIEIAGASGEADRLYAQMLALLDAEKTRDLGEGRLNRHGYATQLDVVRTRPWQCRARGFREVDEKTGGVSLKGGGPCRKPDCPACLDMRLRDVILPGLATWAADRELWAGHEDPEVICDRRGLLLWLQKNFPRDYFANRLRGQLLAPGEFTGAERVPVEHRAEAILYAVLAAPARTGGERLGRDRFVLPATVDRFRKRRTKSEPDGKVRKATRMTVSEFRTQIDERYGQRVWSAEDEAQPTVLTPAQAADYIENVAEREQQQGLAVMAAMRDPDNRIFKDERLHVLFYGEPRVAEIPTTSWWQR